MRIYGRGGTNKKLKEAYRSDTSYVVDGEFMKSLKSRVVEDVQEDLENEMTKLNDMRKDLEEENLRKKAELEDIQREIDRQRDTLFEEVMRKIIGRLPPDIARQYLS